MAGGDPAGGAFSEALVTIERWRRGVAGREPPPPFHVPTPPPGAAPAPPFGDPGLTSVRQVEAALDAIDQRNDELGAFVEVFADRALSEAAACDAERARGELRGPLHGVPISVKDLYAVEDSLTRAGSGAFQRRDDHDATAVARLRAAGAVILGKTVTHEFAMGVISPTSRNPRDPDRIAGGSSSGAAIAVATAMGPAALGTDTRGSIRIPAALCGVVGFKPALGAVPLVGVVPLSWSMDHCGVIAGSVEDAAAVFSCIRERPPGPRTSDSDRPTSAGLRVGLPRAAWSGIEADVDRQVEAAIARLAEAGAEIAELERPTDDDFDTANLASIVVSRCEALAFHRGLGLDQTLYGEDVRLQLAAAEAATAHDYIDAQRLRSEMRDALISVFDAVDVLAMPTVPLRAPLADAVENLPLVLTRNVAIWSFTGFPAVSVPCETPGQGLPAGLQLVAAPGREGALLALAGIAAANAR